MKSKILAAVVSLGLFLSIGLLVSCEKTSPYGSDNYTFEKKEWDNKNLSIVVVTHPTYNSLRQSGPAAKQGQELMAWAKVSENGSCEIHIVDPAVSYKPEYMGHELAHCIYGRWHPSQD